MNVPSRIISYVFSYVLRTMIRTGMSLYLCASMAILTVGTHCLEAVEQTSVVSPPGCHSSLYFGRLTGTRHVENITHQIHCTSSNTRRAAVRVQQYRGVVRERVFDQTGFGSLERGAQMEAIKTKGVGVHDRWRHSDEGVPTSNDVCRFGKLRVPDEIAQTSPATLWFQRMVPTIRLRRYGSNEIIPTPITTDHPPPRYSTLLSCGCSNRAFGRQNGPAPLVIFGNTTRQTLRLSFFSAVCRVK